MVVGRRRRRRHPRAPRRGLHRHVGGVGALAAEAARVGGGGGGGHGRRGRLLREEGVLEGLAGGDAEGGAVGVLGLVCGVVLLGEVGVRND